LKISIISKSLEFKIFFSRENMKKRRTIYEVFFNREEREEVKASLREEEGSSNNIDYNVWV